MIECPADIPPYWYVFMPSRDYPPNTIRIEQQLPKSDEKKLRERVSIVCIDDLHTRAKMNGSEACAEALRTTAIRGFKAKLTEWSFEACDHSHIEIPKKRCIEAGRTNTHKRQRTRQLTGSVVSFPPSESEQTGPHTQDGVSY